MLVRPATRCRLTESGELEGFGIPPAFVAILVDSDLGVSRGELNSTSRDLQHLIGHPATTLAAAAGLKAP